MKRNIIKVLLIIMTIAMTAICLCAFSACNKDEPTEPDPEQIQPGDNVDGDDDEENGGDVDGENNKDPISGLPQLGTPAGFKRLSTDSFDYEWSAVEGAVGYQFRVSYLSSSEGRIITEEKVLASNKTSYTLTPSKDVFPIGGLNYRVSLIALGDNKNKADSNEATSTVGIMKGIFEWIPIEIDNAAKFMDIESGMMRHYKLTADIDFQGVKFKPLGMTTEGGIAFSGSLDGNGKTIKNIIVSTEYDENEYYLYVGIFGKIKGGVVRDLTIRNFRSISPSMYYSRYGIVGTLCGYMTDATVENVNTVDCSIDWTLYNNYAVPALWLGGLAAIADGDYTVRNCRTDTTITGNVVYDENSDYQAVEYDEYGEIVNRYNSENNAGITVAGGLFAIAGNYNYAHDGHESERRPIERCRAYGDINVSSFDYSVGGLVGDCYPFSNALLEDGQENITAFVDCASYSQIEVEAKRAPVSAKTSYASYKRFIGLLVARCRYIAVERCFSASTIKVAYFNREDYTAPEEYVQNTMPRIGFISVTNWELGNLEGKFGENLVREIENCYYIRSALVNIEIGEYNSMTRTEQNCGGGKNEKPGFYNHSQITAVDNADLDKTTTYVGFDFDAVWQIVDGMPALK